MQVICFILLAVQFWMAVRLFRKIFLEYIFNKKTYEPDSIDCAVWRKLPDNTINQPVCERKAG